MGRLFGTDGVRGVANGTLTAELAMAIGRAAGAVLAGPRRRRLVFCVGCDTRLSADMLTGAVTAGLCSAGADVILPGVVPTPAVAYLVGKYKCDAGIMISASHNSAEFNGIKIFNGDGFKIPDALEEQIENMVLDGAPVPVAPPLDVGRIDYATHATEDYAEHIRNTVPHALDGLRLLLDCANGSAARTAELIFSGLGADVTMLSDRPDGLNINKSCGSTHIEELCAAVKAGDYDGGAAFDGDADRCICVDERGAVIDGDGIMAVCGLDLKSRGRLAHNTIVGTVMTNFGFGRFCRDNGIDFIATRVGDRFVLEEMLVGAYNLGGEQSGHVIFRDFATTGDGQLTAAQLFSLVARRGGRLSDYTGVMTRYPQVMRNVQVSEEGKLAFYTDEVIRDAIEAAKGALGERGRIVVRVSGTEPLVRVMAEGENEEEITAAAGELEGLIAGRIGSAG